MVDWCLRERKVDRLLVSFMADAGSAPRRLSRPEALRWVLRHGEDRIRGAWMSHTWPGVEYAVPEAGLVLEVDFDRRLGEVWSRIGPRLSDWTTQHDPPLPEDLCFYRDGDAVPASFSLTHERQYWVLSEQKPRLRTWFDEAFDPVTYLVLVGRPRFLPESARTVDATELARLVE